MRLQPSPGDDIDPVGHLLRDLDRVCTDLQFLNPIRLYGDRSIIMGAMLALSIINERIEQLRPDEPESFWDNDRTKLGTASQVNEHSR